MRKINSRRKYVSSNRELKIDEKQIHVYVERVKTN